jgi:hypothetical protein
MLDWIKRLLPAPEPAAPPPTPAEALARLQTMTTDVVVEDVWDGLDLHAVELEPEVRQLLVDGTLGPYPAHAATIWLAYRRGNVGRVAEPEILDRLEDSVTWALQFEENNVLIGGALGALDSVPEERREALALAVFEAMGEGSARRYWLLLKVRTDAMLDAVSDALERYDPRRRAKMAGAFRQFQPEDVALLLRHYDADSPGAAMFLEALGATGSRQALDVVRMAVDDPRPEVARAALRARQRIERE